MKKIALGALIAAVVVLIDQFTKNWVIGLMQPPHVEAIFSNLNVVLSWNRGVTFGFLNMPHEWIPMILVGITFGIVLYLFWWLTQAVRYQIAVGLGFVIGGALGNLADRIRFGAVVDFIDFHVAGYHWYTFNMADSAILCGVALLLVDQLVSDWKKDKPQE